MIVTISWPRFTQLIRELENTPTATDDEIEVRLASYARRAFDQCAAEFGIRVGNLSQPARNSVAHFHADISGARDWAGVGVDWDKLMSGLRWLRVVAVPITVEDWMVFCDKLFGAVMQQHHDGTVALETANIGVEELPAHVDQWVRHICWNEPQGGNGTLTQSEELLQELETQSALSAAGLKDPLANHNAVTEYRQAEEAEYQQAQQQYRDLRYKDFVRNS